MIYIDVGLIEVRSSRPGHSSTAHARTRCKTADNRKDIDFPSPRGTLTYTGEPGRDSKHLCPRPGRIADLEVFLHIARRIDAYTAYITLEARIMRTVLEICSGLRAPGTLAILLVASGGQAQVRSQYEVTVIQAPECPIFGWPPTWGLGLDEQGHVVGYHWQCGIGNPGWGDHEAFVWTPETGMVDLPRPPGFIWGQAWDIEGDQIVGSLFNENITAHAALWQNGEVIELGTMPGGNFSEARAISPDGRIIGTWGNSATGDPALGALLWEDGLMMNIHADLGAPNSEARDITVGPRGVQVVGWMGDAWFIDSHAYIWRDGIVTDLGVIPGGFTAAASGINSSGTEVVGSGQVPAKGFPFGQARGFLWREGKMIVIPPLPPFLYSSAADISDDGLVLVNMWGGAGNTALVWLDGVMTDLNDLIPPDLDVSIRSAWAINSSGQIAAQGAHAEFGTVGVLLTPVKEALGDLDGDGTVGVLDLLILLSAWGPCADPPDDCPADLDTDDGLVLVNMWGGAGNTALVWLDGVMTDLNDLIPPDLDVSIRSAWAINSSGQIAAQGAHAEFGTVGVLLTPVKEALGDLDGDGTVGVLDLLILLSAWGPCADPPDDCPADLDTDDTVGILDLLILLANWG